MWMAPLAIGRGSIIYQVADYVAKLEGSLTTMGTSLPITSPPTAPKWIRWAPILLALPALIPLAGALIVPWLNGMVPTGFVEYDMPSYLADGRAYFYPHFHLTYSNPSAPYGSPSIYFQPQFLLLGLMQQLGLDPGITFNIFGLITLFFAAAVAVKFYTEVVGVETKAKRIGLICFFWGGGVFTLVGSAFALVKRGPLISVFYFEPTWGWWMLNFGRNLVYPTEALYHGLFLLTILFLFRKKFLLCLALAALLCISHPFTGLSLVLILIAYSGLELVLRSGAVTFKFLLGAILIVALDLTYYMVWLNRFSDHRAVQSEMSRAWLYRPGAVMAALMIVGGLAIWRLARSRFQCFHEPRTRLFAVWFLVVFALSQNNRFLRRPIQPIHFAHGYDWTALFFLGAPLLISMLDSILKISRPLVRRSVVALLLGLFLLDNAAWFAKIAVHNEFVVALTKDQSDALNWLSHNVKYGDMVICQDSMISYLVSVYTPGRSWKGHDQTTPYMTERSNEIDQLFNQGIVLPAWQKSGVIFVGPAAWSPPAALPLTRVYEDPGFSIWTAPQS
jgi:hypothetical protein